MNTLATTANVQRLRLLAYIAGFCLQLSVAIAAYVNSSFLETLLPETQVGLVYATTYLLTIISSVTLRRITARHGTKWTLAHTSFISLLALTGLATIATGNTLTWLGVILLAVYLIAGSLLSIDLDVYLESISDNADTGKIRGIFLTLSNLAWLLSPLAASLLVSEHDYSRIYGVAALALLPFLILVLTLKKHDPKHYQAANLSTSLRSIFIARAGKYLHLKKILAIDLLLNIFYAIMAIYMPLYLVTHLGFSWPTVGVIFTVMLIPFVVLDFILGKLADTRWGEKEVLLAGLVIIILSTLAIPFITSTSAWLWALILFATRVGAASIEIMKETYLFKKIGAQDINTVFISRNTYPLAYIIAPLVGSVLLFLASFPTLFALLGIVLIIGVPITLSLEDTK